MHRRVYVYVAGPLTKGDTFENCRQAIEMGEQLVGEGFIPFVPHSMMGWPLRFSHDWDWWMEYDEAWLIKCDAMFRLPGESPGADREEEFCQKHHIPVFTVVSELLQWADQLKQKQ